MSTPNTEHMELIIEAKGEVISSNFPAFAEMVRARLSEINRELSTDEDFDQADADAKAIAGAEASLKAAKEKALADAEQLHMLFSQIDALGGDLSAARLDLSRQIAKRKEERKVELIEEALASFGIDAGLARKTYLSGLQAAIKGKRTVDSMQKALRIFATCQQAMITRCRGILTSFEKAHGGELTMDRRELEIMQPASVEAELRRRLEAKRAAEERKLLEQEAAKAKAEAAAAIKQAEEAAKPPLPPAGTSKGGERTSKGAGTSEPAPGETAFKDPIADEWAAFKTAVFTSFGPLKSAKESLRHRDNIARAARFGQGVNAAWNAANAKEVAL